MKLLHTKKTRYRRGISQILVVLLACLFSSSKAKIPIYAGLILDETWPLVNTSSLHNENVQTVNLSVQGQGLEDILRKGCEGFAKNGVVSLLGPSNGLSSNLGHIYSQYLSVPYIGVGLQSSIFVSR